MQLVHSPFNETPEQEFQLNTNQRISVRQLSLWVYTHALTDGASIRIRLYNTDGNVLLYSKTMTGAEVKTSIGATQTYAHGKLNLDTGTEVLLGRGAYKVTAEQLSEYTDSTYISWCTDWESTYQELESASTDDMTDPYYLRLYDRRMREV